MSGKKSILQEGDEIYEVLIYKVRKARVKNVCRVLLKAPVRQRVYIYEIECEDGTPSPRYYESDIGKVLFTDIEDAKRKLLENLDFRSQLGGRDFSFDASGQIDEDRENARDYEERGA